MLKAQKMTHAVDRHRRSLVVCLILVGLLIDNEAAMVPIDRVSHLLRFKHHAL